MAISFVLLWWHIPVVLFIGGMVLMMVGMESRLGAFGWPTTEPNSIGCVGIIATIIGAVLLIGSIYRGFFL